MELGSWNSETIGYNESVRGRPCKHLSAMVTLQLDLFVSGIPQKGIDRSKDVPPRAGRASGLLLRRAHAQGGRKGRCGHNRQKRSHTYLPNNYFLTDSFRPTGGPDRPPADPPALTCCGFATSNDSAQLRARDVRLKTHHSRFPLRKQRHASLRRARPDVVF